MVHWRYVSIGFTFALLFISFALLSGGLLKFLPFPELDGDIAEARIILPPGSTLQQTEQVVDRIVSSAKQLSEQYSRSNAEPAPLVRDITVQYNFNADAGETGAHIATVRLDLLSAKIRNSLIDSFINDWRLTTGELAMPISLVFKQPAMGPAGRDIELRLQHSDLTMLKHASIDLQAYLSQFNGVNGIVDDMRPGKEEILIHLKPGAENHALNGQTIAMQLRSAYYGQTADEIQVGPENIAIHVRLNKEQAGDLQTLSNFPIMLADGSQIPLSSVAFIDFQRAFVRIQRVDSQRTITVMADIDNSKANGNEIVANMRNEFIPLLKQHYAGIIIDFEGAAKESDKTGSSLRKGFLIGLFGIFVILSFQFRSYSEPLVVMFAIPLALIGVLFGHYITGYSLSMPSIMGFISLAGIVVNDSILLVQYIRHHIELGDKVVDAVVLASRDRLRAVFLTSLTTAAGLLPLLLETSLQAQVVKPLVVSIVFGIFSSTLLVLFIIPCAYAVLDDFNLVHRHQKLTAK
ncbi:efflux RND transporter permease subunit [Psychromonas sp. MME2]